MNISNILSRSAASFGDRPVLYSEDNPISFSHLASEVRGAAALLRSLGVNRGDRVALCVNNSPEWFAALFAIAALGATSVPINPGLSAVEACAIVDHCEPKVAVVDGSLAGLFNAASAPMAIVTIGATATGAARCDREWRSELDRGNEHLSVESMDPADDAIIFYTSGTTGQPKGVVISHSAVMFIVKMFSKHSMISHLDTSLVMGSLAFIYPLVINALASLYGGATVVLQARFHPERVARIVESRQVSVIMGVPTMYTMMANWGECNEHNLASIRLAYSAGASFPASLVERVKRTLGFHVFDLWGMTECTPVTSYDPRVDRCGRPDSAGRELPGCAFRVVDDDLRDVPTGDVGEVLLTSPAQMTCYFRNADATTEALADGWVRSGDLGFTDSEGYLYIVGRKKDLIIRGGANVYPVDVEEVIFSHSAVAECAVVGVPDNIFGERVKAFIVLKPDATANSEMLAAHCRSVLTEYKVPSSFEFVDALPKGPTGKILRRALREMQVAQT